MLGLVRRNAAFRGLSKPLLLSVLTAMFVGNLMAFSAGPEDGPVFDVRWLNLAGQIALVLPAIFVMSLGQAGGRARRAELSLPLPAISLWRAHFVALAVAVGMILALTFAALVGLGHLLTDATDRFQPDLLAGLQLVVRPGAVCFGVVALLAAWRPGLARPELAAGWTRWRLGLGVGALLLVALLTLLPAALAVVPAMVGVLAVGRAQRLLGATLDLGAAAEPNGGSAARAPGQVDWSDVPAAPRTVHLLIIRTVLKCPSYLVFMTLLLVVIGIALSGFLTRDSDSDAMRLSSFFLIVYILFSPVGVFINSLHKLDHLPIARRVLLAWLLLPGSASLICGYGLGQLGLTLQPDRSTQMHFVNDVEGYGLKLPARYFDPVWDDTVPTVTAPWGETRALETWRVWPGLPLHLVKPYTTPDMASREFVAWQLSRAIAAVYGTEIPAAEVAERYLQTDDKGRTEVVPGGLTLRADYPDLSPAAGGPVFFVLVGSLLSATLLLLWSFFGALSRAVLRRHAKAGFIGVMSGLMVLHLAVFVGQITGLYNEDIVFGLVLGQIQALGDLGVVGWLAAGGGLILLLGLLGRGVERAFAGLEPPQAGRLTGTC